MGSRYRDDGLTERQSAFVREYAVDRNARQAALRAGYSKTTAGAQAHKWLDRPKIREAVGLATEELQKHLVVDAQWIEKHLAKEAVFTGGNASHAGRVNALMGLAKLKGLLIDKVDMDSRTRVISSEPMKTTAWEQVYARATKDQTASDEDAVN